ncbi:amidohydrolase family protein [Pedobacter sp. MR2016-24]|uniref:amidohydrolase family protein n=1 Tax=Pedobacter sp. MR2016-24 TaxID=2994466 RepID=UPI0022461935|nr:amidohydrolase family protein [Pedobacter sp. MR2016-24]MCX2484591.1 amidohydrolase family protein [Pedobacter sp. MR2016-24]
MKHSIINNEMNMRIVTLEEHISFPEMTQKIPKEALGGFGQSERMQQLIPKLDDITGERLQSMDDNGISTQVLSVDSSGANLLSQADAPAFASQYNDLIAQRIAGFEQRFTAFAHLPMTAPLAAADELERVVKEYNFRGAMIRGLTQGMFLDQPQFAPVFEKAEKLGVPIYLHPGLPPKGIADIYYSGLPNHSGMAEALACYGWGWHAETALHVLRLLYSGVFDRYPKLKLIIGHMGEMLPMMMVRSERAFKPGNGGANQRTLTDTFHQQVHITTSGFFTQPPLKIALETFGVDNIMFSVDYPFSTNEMGIAFLNGIELPDEQVRQIAHSNADKLLNLKL